MSAQTITRNQFPGRDHASERLLLDRFSIDQIEFAMLQRDWEDASHGDLDIIVNQNDWPKLVHSLIDFCAEKAFAIVKAYEIEAGIICIVILTDNGAVFLDAAITRACRRIFGITPKDALARAETHHGLKVLREEDYSHYKSCKREFKSSMPRKWLRKLTNSLVITRRLIECTTCDRGALLYIPYLLDTDILRSNAVTKKTLPYLATTLRARYAAPRTG